MKQFLVAITLFSFSILAKANIRLPAIIGSHMVLQQNTSVTIWGWCEPSEKIRVMVDWDTSIYTTTGTNGAKFSVQIKTPKAGGPFKIILNGNNAVVIEDVLVGEVWVCSGQSNMEFTSTWGSPWVEAEIPKATNTNIHFFHVARSTSQYPQDDLVGSWVVCSPEEMRKFSSVGYFFGNKLAQTLKYPIGLISSNWGGTPAEVWTPSEVVAADTILKNANQQLNEAPWWPKAVGATYNAMIYPLTNYSIAGTIWYQGESNCSTAATYESLFSSMIKAWRNAWKKDFPFYFVQIAPFTYGNLHIRALLSEQQNLTAAHVSNTGVVVVSDLVDDIKDIHPKNKVDVGLRLANYALAETYGQKDIVYKSPTYSGMKKEGSAIRISFDNASDGLVSKGGAPTEFYIAGDDQKFVAATAKIEGNTVIISNPAIKNPVAVRFAFSNTAMANLFNKAGLPANLFRTDDWLVDTSAIK